MDFYGQKCTEEWLPVWRSSFRVGEKKDFLNKFTLEIPLTEYITWKVKQINNYFHKIFHLICGGVLNLPLILYQQKSHITVFGKLALNTQTVFTCSKPETETLQQIVKSVQSLHYKLWTDFRRCSDVLIADFEQVDASWDD